MPPGIYKHKKGYKRPPFSKEWKRNISKANKGRVSWNAGTARIEEVICPVCGKKFSDKRFKKRIYCSRQCFGKTNIGKKYSYERRRKMAQDHKGQIPWSKGKKLSAEHIRNVTLGRKKYFDRVGRKSTEHMLIKKSKKYADWRGQVFQRDAYTCLVCGQVGCQINAHHIKSFAKYPDLRFNIDNGITLCVACHELTDNYGNREGYKRDRARLTNSVSN